jgi:hypothetical protein
MAFKVGKDAKFVIDDSSGDPQNISVNVTSVSLPSSVETGETTTFTDSSKTFIPGLIDHTLSIEGYFDSTADLSDAVLSGLVGHDESSTFTFAPHNAATFPEYEGECWITSYEVSAATADVISFSAAFQCTGTVDRNTIA